MTRERFLGVILLMYKITDLQKIIQKNKRRSLPKIFLWLQLMVPYSLAVDSFLSLNIIILFDSSVLFSSGFHNPNYLEIKLDLISKFLAPMF